MPATWLRLPSRVLIEGTPTSNLRCVVNIGDTTKGAGHPAGQSARQCFRARREPDRIHTAPQLLIRKHVSDVKIRVDLSRRRAGRSVSESVASTPTKVSAGREIRAADDFARITS